MSHSLIAHQDIGDSFSGVYYVEQSHVKQTVQKKDYTDMLLRDKSGSRPVKYWGTVKDLDAKCWVFIGATVEEYQGGPSIIARNVEIVTEPESLSNHIPVYEGGDGMADEFDRLRQELSQLVEKTGEKTSEMLVEQVFDHGSFFDLFVRCPASSGAAYGKRGGLLACVVRTTRAALDMARFYGASEEEQVVILSAAFLCQIGGVDACEFVDCMPAKTERGLLLGLPSLTMTRINAALRRVASQAKQDGVELNRELLLRVLHAVVASSNTCGVRAATKEAMLLQHVVKMNNEVSDAQDFIENDVNDDAFTAYDPKLRRRYYRGQ